MEGQFCTSKYIRVEDISVCECYWTLFTAGNTVS